jgi:hypothetical protein
LAHYNPTNSLTFGKTTVSSSGGYQCEYVHIVDVNISVFRGYGVVRTSSNVVENPRKEVNCKNPEIRPIR